MSPTFSIPGCQVDRTASSQRLRNGIAREDRASGGLGVDPHPSSSQLGSSHDHDLHLNEGGSGQLPYREFCEEPLLSSMLHRSSYSSTGGREDGAARGNGSVTGGSQSSAGGNAARSAHSSPRMHSGGGGTTPKESHSAGSGSTSRASARAAGGLIASSWTEEMSEWEEAVCQPLWFALLILFRALDQGCLEQQKQAVAALLASAVEGQ